MDKKEFGKALSDIFSLYFAVMAETADSFSELFEVAPDECTRIYTKNCKKCTHRNGCSDKKTVGIECKRYIPEKKIKRYKN